MNLLAQALVDAADVAQPVPPWLRWLHFTGVVVYAGGVLTLTRMVGHVVRFPDAASRAPAIRVLKRMHKLVDWPGLVLLAGSGLTLLFWDPADKDYLTAEGSGYFHMKLTFIVVLLVCDVVLTRKLFALDPETPGKAAPYKILHGVAALAVLAILAAVTIVKGA